MKSFAAALSLLALALPVFSVPTKVPIPAAAGPVEEDSYIIKLKDDANKNEHLAQLADHLGNTGSAIAYDYNVIHGYSATLKGSALDYVQSSKDVEYIELDNILALTFEQSAASGPVEPSTAAPILPRADAGAGIDVYGIDTGIYVAHHDFGGRAKWGATFGGYKDADGNGHGTHTAATAVGTKYGVAPKANVIAVKVLSDQGSGKVSDILAGVNWAVDSALKSKKPSIFTLSLGGPAGPSSASLDKGIETAISKGIHFTIAAGNSNQPASTSSPADVAAANTIGAVDSQNVKASFSNYGPVVDVWAPGVDILSAWIGSPDATNTISGTSMATPFVAGILAVALSEHGTETPAKLSADLKSHARHLVTGIDSTSDDLLATKW